MRAFVLLFKIGHGGACKYLASSSEMLLFVNEQEGGTAVMFHEGQNPVVVNNQWTNHVRFVYITIHDNVTDRNRLLDLNPGDNTIEGALRVGWNLIESFTCAPDSFVVKFRGAIQFMGHNNVTYITFLYHPVPPERDSIMLQMARID